MKIGGPEGGGEGQSFVAKMKEAWRATDFDAIDAERQAAQVQKAEAEQKAREDAYHEEQKRAQSPEAVKERKTKIQGMVESFDRLAKNEGQKPRTNEQVDQFLKSTNADIRDTAPGAEAWAQWKEQRARAAVEAASSSEVAEEVASLEEYRQRKARETGAIEDDQITVAD